MWFSKHKIHVVDGKQTNKPNGYEVATTWVGVNILKANNIDVDL